MWLSVVYFQLFHGRWESWFRVKQRRERWGGIKNRKRRWIAQQITLDPFSVQSPYPLLPFASYCHSKQLPRATGFISIFLITNHTDTDTHRQIHKKDRNDKENNLFSSCLGFCMQTLKRNVQLSSTLMETFFFFQSASRLVTFCCWYSLIYANQRQIPF